jgi:hypothetical protein
MWITMGCEVPDLDYKDHDYKDLEIALRESMREFVRRRALLSGSADEFCDSTFMITYRER